VIVVVALALVVAAIAWLRTRFIIVTVVGNSMSPTLRHRDSLIARRRRGREIHRGDIVVFVPPVAEADLVYRVKRVAAIAGDPAPTWLGGDRVAAGKLVVIGDNPNSQDSRHYGDIDVTAVLAVVTRPS
jgi:signal peptidase I